MRRWPHQEPNKICLRPMGHPVTGVIWGEMGSNLGLRGGSMNDPEEVQLGKLAKRVLAMPPKKREDSKLGKPRNPSQKHKERPASKGRVHKGRTRA